MKLGLDLNGTITHWLAQLDQLANAVIEAGGEVYIISACLAKNRSKTQQRIENSGIPTTGVEIVVYEKYEDIPNLKLPILQRLGIDLYIDDNEAVVHWVILNGICALLIQGDSRY